MWVVLILVLIGVVMFFTKTGFFNGPTGEVILVSSVGGEGESGAPVTGGVITGGAITVNEGNGILTRLWRWVVGGDGEE